MITLAARERPRGWLLEMSKKRTTLPSPDEIRRSFNYDPETGELRWAVRRSDRMPVGKIAGTRSRRYRTVCFDCRMYAVQNVIWCWMTGEWPPTDMEIDHANGNGADNRWVNLRLATRSQNQANRPYRGNKCGFKGVGKTPHGRYAAAITVHRKRHYLGMYDTPEEAHAAYCDAAQKHFGEFARLN